MIKNIFYYMTLSLMLCMTLASCEEHEMAQDFSTKIGHILCTDGKVVTLPGRCPFSLWLTKTHTAGQQTADAL